MVKKFRCIMGGLYWRPIFLKLPHANLKPEKGSVTVSTDAWLALRHERTPIVESVHYKEGFEI